jgi:DNA modification methylase
MVAAQQIERVCYGIEIDPRFVAATLERMKDMGLKSELRATENSGWNRE